MELCDTKLEAVNTAQLMHFTECDFRGTANAKGTKKRPAVAAKEKELSIKTTCHQYN